MDLALWAAPRSAAPHSSCSKPTIPGGCVCERNCNESDAIPERVKTGKECARVLSACGKPDYQKQLGKEFATIGDSEMWQAGKAVRALRPKESARAIAAGTKGIAGRAAN